MTLIHRIEGIHKKQWPCGMNPWLLNQLFNMSIAYLRLYQVTGPTRRAYESVSKDANQKIQCAMLGEQDFLALRP
jgi:hypothetical protein